MFALQLQDLADNPTIRSPSLNTAECVIQGHKPDFATGRSHYVRAMLWLSMCFVIFSGPLLAKNIRDIEDLSSRNSNSEKKNKFEAVCFSFYFLSLFSSLLIVVAFGLSIMYWKLGGTFHFTVIIIIVFVLSSLESFCVIGWFEHGDSKLLFLLKVYGGHAISYIFCWIIIGIRINPTWGLTIALLVFTFFASVTYAKYIYLEEFPNGNSHSNGCCTTTNSSTTGSTSSNGSNSKKNSTQAKVICVAYCLVVLLLFLVVIFAGHSSSGKEMAVDEVLKATSLYFITAFISWATWKKHVSADARNMMLENVAQDRNMTIGIDE